MGSAKARHQAQLPVLVYLCEFMLFPAVYLSEYGTIPTGPFKRLGAWGRGGWGGI